MDRLPPDCLVTGVRYARTAGKAFSANDFLTGQILSGIIPTLHLNMDAASILLTQVRALPVPVLEEGYINGLASSITESADSRR